MGQEDGGAPVAGGRLGEQEALQQELADDMLLMARQLGSNARAFQESMGADSHALQGVEEGVERNRDNVGARLKQLRKFAQDSGGNTCKTICGKSACTP